MLNATLWGAPPTKVVAETVGEDDPERVAVVFYGPTLLALDLALTVFVATRSRTARSRGPSYALDVVAIVVAGGRPRV